MGATKPEQVIEQFIQFFNSRDLDSLMQTLYEADVVFVAARGACTVTGIPAVREELRSSMALGATMSLLSTVTLRNGDIALTHNRWRLEVPGGEVREGVTAEVIRRQVDGTWKYAIDNPWGGAGLDAAQ